MIKLVIALEDSAVAAFKAALHYDTTTPGQVVCLENNLICIPDILILIRI